MFPSLSWAYLYKLLGKPLIESLMYHQGRRSGSKSARAHFALAHTLPERTLCPSAHFALAHT